MQRIKDVKARKEFMENLGATVLVIFTYVAAGFAGGIGIAFGIAIFI